MFKNLHHNVQIFAFVVIQKNVQLIHDITVFFKGLEFYTMIFSRFFIFFNVFSISCKLYNEVSISLLFILYVYCFLYQTYKLRKLIVLLNNRFEEEIKLLTWVHYYSSYSLPIVFIYIFFLINIGFSSLDFFI